MSIWTFRYGDKGTIISVSGVMPTLQAECWKREWQLSSSQDKAMIIAQLHDLLCGKNEAYEYLSQRAGLVVDEMLENALYSAPRDSAGNALFTKGSERELLSGEKINLKCAFDGEQLFLGISDSWGNLSSETVEWFLSMNENETDHGIERAGRGLFIMWKFLDYFYVNISPGVETAMGGVLNLHPATDTKGA